MFEHPPSISAPAHRRTKQKTAFESSRKIISKLFRSFFGSGQNWGHQGSKFQNFSKRFLDDKIFNFKGRATILIPSCLSRQCASNHACIIWPWKVKVKIWPQVKSGQGHSVTQVGQIIHHSMCLAETNTMTAIPRLYLIWFFSAQNRVKWRHKIRPIANNFRPILISFARDYAKLMPGEVCQGSCRYNNKWRSYFGKTEGGGRIRTAPPGGGGLNLIRLSDLQNRLNRSSSMVIVNSALCTTIGFFKTV